MNSDRDWTLQAACRGEDPTIFHPDYGPDKAGRDKTNDHALAFCDTCPVKETCLQDAITTELAEGDLGRGGPWGIRGGTTEQARTQIIRATKTLNNLTEESP